ncbi:unnamed protein product [Microthlaspi erraticum]|uniref:Uncharacterized protein n=1 Tax=Microthlaspi erraticum TaxID=1685480 RepID=A0A6D2KH20_9BRAS|nr:unnamed protein product [Microthlaspi erraticum]
MGFKTGFGSTAALGRSVGTIGRTGSVGRRSCRMDRSWPVGDGRADRGRPLWSDDEDLADEISRPDARQFPGSDGAFVRGTRSCAAARLASRLALWSCAAWSGVAWPTAGLVSRVVMRDRPMVLDFGRDFRRTDEIWPSVEHRSSASRTARLGADSR